MSTQTVYFAGNTMVVELSNLQDIAGTPITSGSGTANVYDLAGTLLGTGALAFVSSGLFRAVLAHTIAVDIGSTVLVDSTLDSGGQRGRWREEVPVAYRPYSV